MNFNDCIIINGNVNKWNNYCIVTFKKYIICGTQLQIYVVLIMPAWVFNQAKFYGVRTVARILHMSWKQLPKEITIIGVSAGAKLNTKCMQILKYFTIILAFRYRNLPMHWNIYLICVRVVFNFAGAETSTSPFGSWMKGLHDIVVIIFNFSMYLILWI